VFHVVLGVSALPYAAETEAVLGRGCVQYAEEASSCGVGVVSISLGPKDGDFSSAVEIKERRFLAHFLISTHSPKVSLETSTNG